MLLAIVRHGETIQNKMNIVQGQMPGRLSELGMKQAVILGFKLQKIGHFDQIISSDLKRAVDTAFILSKSLKIPNIEYHKALRERSYGKWEGKSFFQLKRNLSEFSTTLRELKMPGCEDYCSFEYRVMCFFEMLFESKLDQNVIIVTHLGIIELVLNKFWNGKYKRPSNCEGFTIFKEANQTTINIL
jgi:broad specificity phosphatase PhoE